MYMDQLVLYYLVLTICLIVGIVLIFKQVELFGGFVVIVSGGLIVTKLLGYTLLV